ncbi:hypothetical protein SAMN05444266_108304 [Chitinophaga jiangningensis]|uniref:Catalase n=1 Tax=Chitinophaga jiangningensis TaxID=1419482 RepID=A0A1M7JBV1_9BACT|nr:hypothetical protein [Chitinophaga jiangningensis]SHM50482.1 hypothetical protein SAMN05444266_108304 [Chitinophaga jiangningensis]
MHQLHPMHSSQSARVVNCDIDPTSSLKEMFIDMIQRPRALDGQCPVRRPVFSKQHGMVKATFVVNKALSPEKRIGVFQYDQLDAWVRFSSDTKSGLGDVKTTIGVAIKLFGVAGEKLLESEPDASTADFILQNHDVFFVNTAKDMCEFTHAGVVLRDYDSYLKDHPETAKILDDMQKPEPSVATAVYGSCLPYAFGSNDYVKYKLVPLNTPPGPPVPDNNPGYLRDELKQRLVKEEVRFGFYLQFRTDAATMPLDEAMVRWPESISAPELFATLIIHQQDIDAPGQVAYGENLSYNPWHTLAVHQPIGSISDVRKVVYEEGARLRRDRNGIPLTEPRTARK